MKELSIEEKAKRYDSMFERLKEMYNNNKTNVAARLICERYFPELKESEDEGICRKLIAFLRQCRAVYGDGFKQFGLDIDDALAWLEKQGEHVNFLNKIQIGDKVTRNEDGVLVNLSQLKRVAKKDEKQGEQKPAEEYNITGIGSKNAQGKLGEMIKKLKPVNKVLEQKPTEWSEKDVKCIEYAIYACLKAFGTHSDTAEWLEQLKDRLLPQLKQEWSEEDENLLKLSIENLTELKDRFGKEYGRTGDCIDWLKSLRPQNTWKPSDEQIKVCKEVYADILSAKGFDLGTVNSELNRLEEELKKLRNKL